MNLNYTLMWSSLEYIHLKPLVLDMQPPPPPTSYFFSDLGDQIYFLLSCKYIYIKDYPKMLFMLCICCVILELD